MISGCDEGVLPTLQPIGMQSLSVNEELRVTIGINNPQGTPVELQLEDPMLPGFDRVTFLSTEPGGAVFRWAPLSSHVGTHELTFVLRAPGGQEYSRESALFTVNAAADAAPVFVRPGAGGTFDLTRESCVTFDVEVRDDDSSTVEIGARRDLPDGATLANAGNKRAMFDWCPSPDQVSSSERYTIALFADDGEHPRVEHDYVIVLRSGPKDGCPGDPPLIQVLGPSADERIVSGSGFRVEIQVTDDMGLRDEPILYYTTEMPADLSAPDVTQFEQTTFAATSGDRYEARITTLGLDVDTEAQVFFLASATDNDDTTGSACDHRSDSAVVRFFAVGGEAADGTLNLCETCTISTECASGICASSATGGRCVASCAGDGACSEGICGATVTVEGASRAGCGPVSDVCSSGGGGTTTCTDDRREEDDSVATATPFSATISDGQICAGDDDHFELTGTIDERVTVTLSGFTHADGDLDLQLLDSTDTILDQSASVLDEESVTYCFSADVPRIYARVFGYRDAQNSYALEVERSSGATAMCCINDIFEADNTRMTARSITGTDFEGTICPGDEDWIALPVTGPSMVNIDVIFTDADGDIDIQLYNPDGAVVASSVSTTDDESISVSVPGGGTYALRVYAFGTTSSQTQYLGMATVTEETSCSTTNDCPVGTVCNSSRCENATCTTVSTCPAMHLCPEAGPPPAARSCTMNCTLNSDCRASEACKRFTEGRACGPRGTGQNGESCSSYANCGGQRTCLTWPGGYCARAGCVSDSDCESGTFCVTEGGTNVCALSCNSSDDVCRLSEGYRCGFETTVGGTFRFLCLPPRS